MGVVNNKIEIDKMKDDISTLTNSIEQTDVEVQHIYEDILSNKRLYVEEFTKETRSDGLILFYDVSNIPQNAIGVVANVISEGRDITIEPPYYVEIYESWVSYVHTSLNMNPITSQEVAIRLAYWTDTE